jgi:hypothetical protein
VLADRDLHHDWRIWASRKNKALVERNRRGPWRPYEPMARQFVSGTSGRMPATA